MVMVVCTSGAVLLVNGLSAPEGARAQAADQKDDQRLEGGLTPAVPPRLERLRRGTVLNQIAWHEARQRMGADMPSGAGIPVGLVEGGGRGFMPENRGETAETNYIAETQPIEPSGHASRVARYAFAKDSAGHGIRDVHCWSTSDWLTAGYLKAGTLEPPNGKHPARVFNHSWVGADAPGAVQVLRRVDYLVDHFDRLVVCGINNADRPIPALLASSYNAISVGVSGRTIEGLTTLEGEGRVKPDLVATIGATSDATPIVTGCVAAMLELADRVAEQDPDGPNANAPKPQVIKAALLAGAHRSRFWQAPDDRSMDPRWGAGVIDLDRALLILDAGHTTPNTDTQQRYAWSFARIAPVGHFDYRFDITQDQGQAGFALTWHRKVLGGVARIVNPDTGEEQFTWNHAHFLPDLDLQLIQQLPDNSEHVIAISASRVDNVELIHLPSLDAGRYTLRVKRANDRSNMLWDFALAWRIEAPEFDAPDQPE